MGSRNFVYNLKKMQHITLFIWAILLIGAAVCKGKHFRVRQKKKVEIGRIGYADDINTTGKQTFEILLCVSTD